MVSPALLILDSYTSERLSPNQYSFLCMVLQILTTDYSLLIYSYIRYIQWLFLRYFYGSYSSLSLDELSAFHHLYSWLELDLTTLRSISFTISFTLFSLWFPFHGDSSYHWQHSAHFTFDMTSRLTGTFLVFLFAILSSTYIIISGCIISILRGELIFISYIFLSFIKSLSHIPNSYSFITFNLSRHYFYFFNSVYISFITYLILGSLGSPIYTFGISLAFFAFNSVFLSAYFRFLFLTLHFGVSRFPTPLIQTF